MQGPQALASPCRRCFKVGEQAIAARWVARTCSEPGVMRKGSSLEVRAPMPVGRSTRPVHVLVGRVGARPDESGEISEGTRCGAPQAPRHSHGGPDRGVGPLIMGVSEDRSIAMTRSKNNSGSSATAASATQVSGDRGGEVGQFGASGGAQVGPDVRIETGTTRWWLRPSAPMLQIVAFARRADGVGPRPEVLDDGAGAAGHRERVRRP